MRNGILKKTSFKGRLSGWYYSVERSEPPGPCYIFPSVVVTYKSESLENQNVEILLKKNAINMIQDAAHSLLGY